MFATQECQTEDIGSAVSVRREDVDDRFDRLNSEIGRLKKIEAQQREALREWNRLIVWRTHLWHSIVHDCFDQYGNQTQFSVDCEISDESWIPGTFFDFAFERKFKVELLGPRATYTVTEVDDLG